MSSLPSQISPLHSIHSFSVTPFLWLFLFPLFPSPLPLHILTLLLIPLLFLHSIYSFFLPFYYSSPLFPSGPSSSVFSPLLLQISLTDSSLPSYLSPSSPLKPGKNLKYHNSELVVPIRVLCRFSTDLLLSTHS